LHKYDPALRNEYGFKSMVKFAYSFIIWFVVLIETNNF